MTPFDSSITKTDVEGESIQIWTGHKVPECWRRFFPSASELDWIAVVAPTAIRDFGYHLLTNGYRMGIDVCSHALPDGTWMFFGQIREKPVTKNAGVGA
jgi:hypothetical protein